MKKNKETQNQLVLEGTEEEEILARLSDRVEKAVAIIQQLRKEREELKARLIRAEESLNQRQDSSARLSSMESDNQRFLQERQEIRSRIERILDNLESLDASAN